MALCGCVQGENQRRLNFVFNLLFHIARSFLFHLHNIQGLTNKKLTFSLLQQRGPDPAERLDEHLRTTRTPAPLRARIVALFRRDVTRAGVSLLKVAGGPSVSRSRRPMHHQLSWPLPRRAVRADAKRGLTCLPIAGVFSKHPNSLFLPSTLHSPQRCGYEKVPQVSHSGLGTHATPHAPQARTVRPT